MYLISFSIAMLINMINYLLTANQVAYSSRYLYANRKTINNNA